MPEYDITVLPHVDFDYLYDQVKRRKANSTSRYYLAMLKRLEAYNELPVLDLNSVNADYVSGFGEYLLGKGLSFSTVKLFKMAFRALMKDAFGSGFKTQFKAAFKNVDSKNYADTYCISYDDLQRVINCNLENLILLERVRLIFLYCIVSGGLSIVGLKKVVSEGTLDIRIPQQKFFINEFERISGRSFEQSVLSWDTNQYAKFLEQIGIIAGLSVKLRSQSAAEGWIASARKANIPTKVIASVLSSSASFPENISSAIYVTEEEKLHALKTAANNVVDMKPRWFVMKCFNAKPTEIDNKISNAGILSEYDCFSSFIPPAPDVPKGKKSTKKSIIGDMYFFKCTLSTAVALRNILKNYVWVYPLAGTSIPAQISDTEMKNFMLLCDVSEGTLAYHFPEVLTRNKDVVVGREAEITVGNFCGKIGIITELPNNKYKVVMSFACLCAKVTAEVPVNFLRFK